MSTRGSGRYRHWLILMEPIKTQDAMGQPIESWAPVDGDWGQVLDMRGREYIESREVHSELTTKIRMRYRDDISVEWRICHGDRVYDVVQVADIEGRSRELELMCAEVR